MRVRVVGRHHDALNGVACACPRSLRMQVRARRLGDGGGVRAAASDTVGMEADCGVHMSWSELLQVVGGAAVEVRVAAGPRGPTGLLRRCSRTARGQRRLQHARLARHVCVYSASTTIGMPPGQHTVCAFVVAPAC